MTIVSTLYPALVDTFSISGSATASTPTPLPYVAGSVRFVNEGPNNCYVFIGPSFTLATVPTSTPQVTCFPVMAGEDIVYGINSDARNNISIICRSGATCVLLVSVGEGM